MIVAYAQAFDRQGLDAALDGRAVAIKDAAFIVARDKSTALNLRGKVHRVGNVEVRCGRGIVRLELPGAEDDAESRSPIVVAIGDSELQAGASALAGRVVETISAIGRLCDRAAIEAAIAAADKSLRAYRLWMKIGVIAVIALSALGFAAIWVVRTSGGASNA